MKYSENYLFEEYGIIKVGEDTYDMPILWKNSDEAEEFTFSTAKPKEGFKNAIPKLNDLSKLPVENGDTIIVALTNYIEYLAEFQVWNMENYKTDVYLTYNEFDIDNVECLEDVADLIAMWFYIKGYKNITIEVRMCHTEDCVEGFIDYIESK